MPIDITFKKNNGCIFTATGEVSGEDVFHAHHKVITDKRFKNL